MMHSLAPDTVNQTEALIRQIMTESEACGLAACVLDAEGRTVYEQYFGFRNRDSREPVNGDTIFGLASLTKSFTALAIMKMAEDGILSVNDPLHRYIPEFTNRNTDEVTLAHLLTHSGGFFPQPRIVVDEVAEKLGLAEDREHDLAVNEILAAEGGRLVAERLDSLTMENGLIAAPGRYCSYCNDGYGLLSEVIRRHGSEPSYAEYVQKHILEPLGMTRSFCDFVRPAEDENAAVLYDRRDGIMQGHRNYHDDAFVLNGGGAMKSTLNDLKKYLAMYLHQGCGIVQPQSIREMITPRIPFGIDGRYCYGLYTETYGNSRVFQHGGSLPGVSSNILFSYDAGCAVIVLCNTSDVPVSTVSRALFAMYCGLPLKEEHSYPKAEWSLEQMEQVQGDYASGEGTAFSVRLKDGSLILISDGKEKAIRPIRPDTAIVAGTWSDTVFQPVSDEKRGLFAVRYGSRIIPRI